MENIENPRLSFHRLNEYWRQRNLHLQSAINHLVGHDLTQRIHGRWWLRRPSPIKWNRRRILSAEGVAPFPKHVRRTPVAAIHFKKKNRRFSSHDDLLHFADTVECFCHALISVGRRRPFGECIILIAKQSNKLDVNSEDVLFHPSGAGFVEFLDQRWMTSLSSQPQLDLPKKIQEFTVPPLIFLVGGTSRAIHASIFVLKVRQDISLQEFDEPQKTLKILDAGIGDSCKPFQLIDIGD
ncbi:MAG: hypothetical protein ABSH48_03920 [Verrucomicrobiota bacterium]